MGMGFLTANQRPVFSAFANRIRPPSPYFAHTSKKLIFRAFLSAEFIPKNGFFWNCCRLDWLGTSSDDHQVRSCCASWARSISFLLRNRSVLLSKYWFQLLYLQIHSRPSNSPVSTASWSNKALLKKLHYSYFVLLLDLCSRKKRVLMTWLEIFEVSLNPNSTARVSLGVNSSARWPGRGKVSGRHGKG